MNTFVEIIKQTQKFLFCPVCQRKFALEEIRLRGFFDDIYFLQTRCEQSHHPTSITVIVSQFPTNEQMTGDIKKEINSPTRQPQASFEEKYLEELEIGNFWQSLENFDGDFENLWKR